MMKRASGLVVGLLSAALVGCAQPPVIQQSVTPSSSAEAISYKACLMTDSSDTTGSGPAHQALNGLDRAKADLQVTTEAVAADSSAEYPQKLQSLVDSSCSLIVAVGSQTASAVQAAAKANPDVSFALVDAVPDSTPANLRTVFFNVHESAFLAGYAAAASSVSGAVGVFGAIKIPAVTIYMDGFVQGVERYNQEKNEKIAVFGWDLNAQHGAFVMSGQDPFSDPAAGQVAAQSLISSGADVIMAAAGRSGEGALQQAALSGGAKVIWTDDNGCESEAQYCAQQLGSVVKDRNEAVYQLVKAQQSNPGSTGVFLLGVRSQGTDFVPAGNNRFSPEIAAELADISSRIADGTISVSSPSAIG